MTAIAAGRESEPIRVLASTVFAYELVALWTDLPTISRLTHKWPLLGGVIIGGLAVHFQPPRRNA